MSKNVRDLKLFKVKNPYQRALFEIKKKEFEEKGISTELKDMFHGSPAPFEVAESINGVDIYWSKNSDHGFGAYFAREFSYSYNYTN